MNIKIAGIVKESIVDGPGIRLVVFTQGCNHNCKSCHNKDTHPIDGGYDININEIIEMVKENPLLSGITLSGGEPLLQIDESIHLLKKIKDLNPNLNTIVYTGYVFEDIINFKKSDSRFIELLQFTDILIDGPFKEDKKDLLLKFRGSSNQRIIDINNTLKNNRLILLDL